MKNNNVLYAQSGGPSPVINSSLRGAVELLRAMPETFGRVYGGYHGIEGVLKEELLDLSAQDEQEIALLGVTPAAGGIGTCRYKLREKNAEDFARVIDVLMAHRIGYFLYNGGNDSMDTALRWLNWPRAWARSHGRWCARPSTMTWAIPSSS